MNYVHQVYVRTHTHAFGLQPTAIDWPAMYVFNPTNEHLVSQRLTWHEIAKSH